MAPPSSIRRVSLRWITPAVYIVLLLIPIYWLASMSLKKLQGMSRGGLKDEDLAKVDADLRRLP